MWFCMDGWIQWMNAQNELWLPSFHNSWKHSSFYHKIGFLCCSINELGEINGAWCWWPHNYGNLFRKCVGLIEYNIDISFHWSWNLSSVKVLACKWDFAILDKGKFWESSIKLVVASLLPSRFLRNIVHACALKAM